MFDTGMRAIWRTMDSVLALINLVETQFLGYESPQEFANAIEKPPGLLSLLRKPIPRQN